MTNEAREDRLECEQCVLAAIVDVLMANTTEEIEDGLKSLKVCSLQHLSEEHDVCIDMALNSVGHLQFQLKTALKKLNDCGKKIMVRNVVKSCHAMTSSSPGGEPDLLQMFLQVDTRWLSLHG